MYIVKNVDTLENFGYRKYKDGYSKQICGEYDFLDISFDDLIVKKAKFIEREFVYEYADKNDIKELIENDIVKESI